MIASRDSSLQIHGVGVGLRAQHYHDILTEWPEVPWFEILSDNYLVPGGAARSRLIKIRERYPMAMHSVNMSLGSADPINWDYFQQLKDLATIIEPAVISDHLCWVSCGGQYVNELFPLPYTEEAITHVVARISAVQEFLGRRILIENVSSYLTYQHSTLSEWTFIREIAERADCHILLDVNNIFVSGTNHGFDPTVYLEAMDPERIKQIHLAGFVQHDGILVDNHGSAVHAPVWAIYQKALQRFGPVPSLIEWDNHIPSWSELAAEAQTAQAMYDAA